MSRLPINAAGIWAIYRTEMARMLRTIWQSVATPVITTVLYFVVFGGAIGSRMQHVGGVGYGAFIVPGLIMLSMLTHFECLDRYLLSKVHEDDLRDIIGTFILRRGGVRLCRRGGDQVRDPRAYHTCDRDFFRAGPHPASRLDGDVHAADLDRLQPVRLHRRHMGREF
jgi:hypothetical protein